jgi:porphobilinogen synthase
MNLTRRPRRNRTSAAIRGLVRENDLTPAHLVSPIFLVEGKKIASEITSLPGTYRLSIDNVLKEIEECRKLGILSFMMFPAIPEAKKDKEATYSWNEKNFYLKADVAMDPYSSDGHDGYVENGKILNDRTLPILQKMSVAQAAAGFDLIGPSDMMDGRVGAIREALDENKFTDTGIMAYTAKYASAFYGPFRDALDSAPKAGDKKTYQMNPANRREALIEAALDVAEGADFLMVKPALNYLDVIHALKTNFDTPIAAYHVSGECAMLLAACRNGWLDYEKAMPETLMSIRRAGADVIITYLAKDFAKLGYKY